MTAAWTELIIYFCSFWRKLLIYFFLSKIARQTMQNHVVRQFDLAAVQINPRQNSTNIKIFHIQKITTKKFHQQLFDLLSFGLVWFGSVQFWFLFFYLIRVIMCSCHLTVNSNNLKRHSFAQYNNYITKKPQVVSNKTKKQNNTQFSFEAVVEWIELAAALNRPNIIFNSSNVQQSKKNKKGNNKNVGDHLLIVVFYCHCDDSCANTMSSEVLYDWFAITIHEYPCDMWHLKGSKMAFDDERVRAASEKSKWAQWIHFVRFIFPSYIHTHIQTDRHTYHSRGQSVISHI